MFALLLAWPALAGAQPAPAPGQPAPFGAALRSAVSTGAITSGTAYFKSSRNGALITVRTDVLRNSKGVSVTVKRREVGAMREERTAFGCTLDLDGRAKMIRFEYVRGRMRATTGAIVRGKRLLVQDGTDPRILAWNPDWVPFAAAVVLLPRLGGKGLKTPLELTLFHEGTLSANPGPTHLTAHKGGVTLAQVWVQPVLRDQGVSVTTDAAGRLRTIKLGPETWSPLTLAEARALVPTLAPAKK